MHSMSSVDTPAARPPQMTPAQSNQPRKHEDPAPPLGLALLSLGVLVNYFDRVNLSVSRDALQNAFGSSAVMFGYLSSAYNWPYALLQLPSGCCSIVSVSGRRNRQYGLWAWPHSLLPFRAASRLVCARFLLGSASPTVPAYGESHVTVSQDERSLATAMFDSAAKFLQHRNTGAGLVCCVLDGVGFCRDGLISIPLSRVFLRLSYRNPSEGQTPLRAEREYVRSRGAQPEDRARAAKGAPLALFASAAKSLGNPLWLCVLQLQLLSALTGCRATCLPFITSIYSFGPSTRVFPGSLRHLMDWPLADGFVDALIRMAGIRCAFSSCADRRDGWDWASWARQMQTARLALYSGSGAREACQRHPGGMSFPR